MNTYPVTAVTLGNIPGTDYFTATIGPMLMSEKDGVTLDRVGPSPAARLELELTVAATDGDNARERTNQWLERVVHDAMFWQAETGSRVDFEGENEDADYHDISDIFEVTVGETESDM